MCLYVTFMCTSFVTFATQNEVGLKKNTTKVIKKDHHIMSYILSIGSTKSANIKPKLYAKLQGLISTLLSSS